MVGWGLSVVSFALGLRFIMVESSSGTIATIRTSMAATINQDTSINSQNSRWLTSLLAIGILLGIGFRFWLFQAVWNPNRILLF